MKTVNLLLTRLVVKAMKPRNTVLVAMKDRHRGAGSHRKTRGSLRRAENMAVQLTLNKKGDDDA